MSSKSNETVSAFISAELRRLYKTSASVKKGPGEVSLQDIADELGVTKPQVSSALNRGMGVGPKFEDQFAKKFYGGNVDKLRKAAAAWARTHPVLTLVPDEQLPQLNPLDEAVRDTKWPPGTTPNDVAHAIRLTRQDFAKSSEPLPVNFWCGLLLDNLRVAQGTPPKVVFARAPHPVPPPDEESPEFKEARAAKKKR